VGLSLGYGSDPTSFLGVLSGGSKLVLSFMMILGKHRFVWLEMRVRVRACVRVHMCVVCVCGH
jgi:Trk-type K+ transport system membrane component